MTRLIGAIVLVMLLALPAPSGSCAFLEVVSAGRTIWRDAICEHERFNLAFIHSSEGCLWTHYYQAASDKAIEQLSSSFSCTGAGMPVAQSGWSRDASSRYTVTARRAALGRMPPQISFSGRTSVRKSRLGYRRR
ncbi:MAG: hypothetical protein AB7H93_19570 [Vicinamibacterales bacterium]